MPGPDYTQPDGLMHIAHWLQPCYSGNADRIWSFCPSFWVGSIRPYKPGLFRPIFGELNTYPSLPKPTLRNLTCTGIPTLPKAAPVAKWLRSLIFNTLNHSSSHRCGFEPSSGHVRQAKFCLRVVRWFFLGISLFAPPYEMSEIILMVRKTKIKKNNTLPYLVLHVSFSKYCIILYHMLSCATFTSYLPACIKLD